ncbi:MAG: acyl carrier protein [Pseudomonadota bacterium]
MTTIASDDLYPFLIERLCKMTRQDPAAITPTSVFVDMGLQSIDAVLLCGEVEDHFAIELDPETIFEHETLGSFADEISRRMSTQ